MHCAKIYVSLQTAVACTMFPYYTLFHIIIQLRVIYVELKNTVKVDDTNWPIVFLTYYSVLLLFTHRKYFLPWLIL